jgi:hypothetical protein
MIVEKIHLVAILPDGKEYFEDIINSEHFWDRTLDQVGKNAVRKAGLTTSRKNPVKVSVDFFKLEIKDGKLNRVKVKTLPITPDLNPMTKDEFIQEIEDVLSGIPEEFHSFVSTEYNERGSGYEEQVGVARDIVQILAPCVWKYRQRISTKL